MDIGVKQLVDAANAEIETLSVDEALKMQGSDDVVFVDLRDIRELKNGGKIAGARHCPRGMLEFWVDPDSPYHKDYFASGQKFVFYCAMGWRSALATQAVQRMGLRPVAHIDGGFNAWKDAGGAVEELS